MADAVRATLPWSSLFFFLGPWENLSQNVVSGTSFRTFRKVRAAARGDACDCGGVGFCEGRSTDRRIWKSRQRGRLCAR